VSPAFHVNLCYGLRFVQALTLAVRPRCLARPVWLPSPACGRVWTRARNDLPAVDRQLDCSYTNTALLRNLAPRTTVIGRIRKHAQVALALAGARPSRRRWETGPRNASEPTPIRDSTADSSPCTSSAFPAYSSP
jgi:hypothetical protein